MRFHRPKNAPFTQETQPDNKSPIENRQSKIENPSGFSLIELLVAIAVLALMSVMMLTITSSAQRISRQTTSRVEQFREARRAFERINQRLSQATLNTYWDYVDSSGKARATNDPSFTPYKYARLSELRYLQTNACDLTNTMVGKAVFFQAPLGKADATNLSGLNSLLNTVGFFIEKGSDEGSLPPTVPEAQAKTRYRLFELTEPTESLTIYSKTSGKSDYKLDEWFTTPLGTAGYSHRLADNIVALVFQAQYKDAGGTSQAPYDYTSAPRGIKDQPIEENNLPPNVRVTMIAVDEPSARRIEDGSINLTDAQKDGDKNVPNSLGKLEAELIDNKLNYRKFESTVSIGSSKWSAK